MYNCPFGLKKLKIMKKTAILLFVVSLFSLLTSCVGWQYPVYGPGARSSDPQVWYQRHYGAGYNPWNYSTGGRSYADFEAWYGSNRSRVRWAPSSAGQGGFVPYLQSGNARMALTKDQMDRIIAMEEASLKQRLELERRKFATEESKKEVRSIRRYYKIYQQTGTAPKGLLDLYGIEVAEGSNSVQRLSGDTRPLPGQVTTTSQPANTPVVRTDSLGRVEFSINSLPDSSKQLLKAWRMQATRIVEAGQDSATVSDLGGYESVLQAKRNFLNSVPVSLPGARQYLIAEWTKIHDATGLEQDRKKKVEAIKLPMTFQQRPTSPRNTGSAVQPTAQPDSGGIRLQPVRTNGGVRKWNRN